MSIHTSFVSVTEFKRREDLKKSPRCVLFVEDNMDDFVFAIYELAKVKLRNKIRRVSTADEMLRYLRGVDQYLDRTTFAVPAVIVLDLRLPDSDGLEAQAMLRSSLKFRRIPLITISDATNTEQLQTTVELGADASMMKPFKGVDFKSIAEELRLPLEFETAKELIKQGS
ncbi:MAG: response regulator [Limisphaerales bacterium]